LLITSAFYKKAGHFISQPCWETIHKIRKELFHLFFGKDQNRFYGRFQELQKESQCFYEGDIRKFITTGIKEFPNGTPVLVSSSINCQRIERIKTILV